MTDQQPLNADEILDVVDENDQVVGQAPRGETYARRMRTRSAFVLVRDAEDRIFVHRRTPRKLVFPAHYDMFVGGVVGAGETYDQAALREAEEELGVQGLAQPEPLFKFLYETAEHSWWSAVYQVRCTLPAAPQESEIDWSAFLTEEELGRRLDEWPWTPDGMAAYRQVLARREAGEI
ncbi:NUDIX hydrolase [Streptomyces platensis]|uniref:NUDIX hydrolase n=1 Tax=Streptomyces platensis TaxID=58346 RepID=UPI002E80A80C|nr:NUDIX domain-containing protein [Streptomyces platensis]WUB83117.1 NUDIX domain-containing protein [Streptomyces platensis]